MRRHLILPLLSALLAAGAPWSAAQDDYTGEIPRDVLHADHATHKQYVDELQWKHKQTQKALQPLTKEFKHLHRQYVKQGPTDEISARREYVMDQLTTHLDTLENISALHQGMIQHMKRLRKRDGRGNGGPWLKRLESTQAKMEEHSAGIRDGLTQEKTAFRLASTKAGRRRMKQKAGCGAIGGVMVIVVILLAVWVAYRRGKKAATTAPAAGAPVPPTPTQPRSSAAAPKKDQGTPRLIGENFRLDRELGRGGMGIVYEATDLTLKRTVAIKQMREEIAQSKRELDLFLMEAQLVASLKHANLVEIYSIVKENGGIYLVFEYVDGHNLADVLGERIRLPLKHAQHVLRQMGAALDYAHSRRVIHRDLKPSNVMLDHKWTVKVMDFGIAYHAKKTVAKMTRAESWGTPPYMAPEQEIGKVSKESDIFSLGVCFYEMLTGRLPFEGPNFLAQKREMVYAAPTKVTPGLPAQVDALLRRALDPDPAKRYRSASELAGAAASIRA